MVFPLGLKLVGEVGPTELSCVQLGFPKLAKSCSYFPQDIIGPMLISKGQIVKETTAKMAT